MKLKLKMVAAAVAVGMAFAPFFAGSAGCGQPWHWDHMYVDGNDLWWHFGRFARAVDGVDPAAEHFRPFHTETQRLRIWGLRGERTTLLWCRDKLNTWESELVRGEAPTDVSGEKLPFGGEFKCYLPWEDRWTDVVKGDVLPDFTRSIVVKIENPSECHGIDVSNEKCVTTVAVPGEAVSHVPEFILLTTECKPYREKRMTAQPDEDLRKTLDAAVEAGDDFVADFVRVYDMEP